MVSKYIAIETIADSQKLNISYPVTSPVLLFSFGSALSLKSNDLYLSCLSFNESRVFLSIVDLTSFVAYLVVRRSVNTSYSFPSASIALSICLFLSASRMALANSFEVPAF